MKAVESRCVFVTGATGFVGAALLPALLDRGHGVRALARPASLARLPAGCTAVAGDALDAGSFLKHIGPADTLVHLIGVSHPAPWKAHAFAEIDLASVRAVLSAARIARIRHVIYVSVAQPAPTMRAYVAARAQAEQLIRESGVDATILRPWYVLGPGRRWPLLLAPLYWLLERLPATCLSAQRLGLLTREQMARVLVQAVEHPANGQRVLDVPAIRRLAAASMRDG